jgi:hypothetical protein
LFRDFTASAAVELREIPDDRQAQTRAWLVGGAFHNTLHHSDCEARILTSRRSTRTSGRFRISRRGNTPDVDGTLRDSRVLIYGSPMSDANLHSI